MPLQTAKQALRYLWGALPHGVRLGRTYRRTKKFLDVSEWWTREEMDAYRRRELSRLVHHAYEKVPYYRRVFDERGLRPGDIRSQDDLRLLPVLTRLDVKENLEDLIDRNLPRLQLIPVETGGTTTGLPLTLYQARDLEAREWAFVWRGWNWAGYRQGQGRAVLRGDTINRWKRGVEECWKYNPIDRRLIFTSFRMADEDLAVCARKMLDLKPRAILAYPSALYLLAMYLKRNGIPIPSLKCAMTSSEPLYGFQREFVEEHLGVRIFDHYGNSERSVLAMQCEHGGLHVIPEYGILELLGRDGQPIEAEGQVGEVVTTGFLNHAMPLIRYRTEDIAQLVGGECPCGRCFPLLETVGGRTQDFFVTRSGTPILAIFLAEPMSPYMESVDAYQYVQNEPGKVQLRIDARRELTEEEQATTRRVFTGFFRELELELRPSAHIPRTRMGKFRYFIQNLPLNFGEGRS